MSSHGLWYMPRYRYMKLRVTGAHFLKTASGLYPWLQSGRLLGLCLQGVGMCMDHCSWRANELSTRWTKHKHLEFQEKGGICGVYGRVINIYSWDAQVHTLTLHVLAYIGAGTYMQHSFERRRGQSSSGASYSRSNFWSEGCAPWAEMVQFSYWLISRRVLH